MESQPHNEDLIRKFVRDKGPETAPEGFTERLMARISANPVIDDSPLLSKGTWISMILAAAALIIFIFVVDIPFLDRFFSSSGIQKVSMNIFSQGFIDNMASFFNGLNISGITVAIVVAAAGLVVLERLLHRRFSSAKLLFLC